MGRTGGTQVSVFEVAEEFILETSVYNKWFKLGPEKGSEIQEIRQERRDQGQMARGRHSGLVWFGLKGQFRWSLYSGSSLLVHARLLAVRGLSDRIRIQLFVLAAPEPSAAEPLIWPKKTDY